MKLQTTTAVALCAAVLTGCAGRASSVAPVAVSSVDYSGLTCPQAREQLELTRAKVNALSRRQNNAAVADTAGVVLLFLPLGSIFGGNVEGELAQAKGEALALERHITTRCSS